MFVTGMSESLVLEMNLHLMLYCDYIATTPHGLKKGSSQDDQEAILKGHLRLQL